MQLPRKLGSFILSNLSLAYSFLQQKKYKPKSEQTLPYPWPCFFWVISTPVFVNWKENACIAYISIFHQKSGGCMCIIQEIKGWRNFILIWGQQNKVTEEQHVCLSATQIKANPRQHDCWQDWEAETLLWSPKLDPGLAWTHKNSWHLHLTELLTRGSVTYT